MAACARGCGREQLDWHYWTDDEQGVCDVCGDSAVAAAVDPDPDRNWANNAIQFPRLLSELAGLVPSRVLDEVAMSMDLTRDQIAELLDRADDEWQRIKELTK